VKTPARVERRTTPLVYDPDRLAAVRRAGLLDTGPEEAFDRLSRLAARLLGAPFAFVTVVDDTRSYWKSRVGLDGSYPVLRQHPVEHSICQYVVGSGAEVIIDDAGVDPRTRGNHSMQPMGIRAWAGFPLRAPNGSVLGTFAAADIVVRRWTKHDLEILSTLAHAAAAQIALRMAVEEAREATRQAQKAALAALQAADEAAMLSRTLQESLLPAHLPDIPGLDIAARYLRGGRGADVLGDFYDVFASPRGTWGVVVGDVSGKGPQAAKTTALARYTLRAAALRRASPRANLDTLNTALLEWFTDDAQFLTAVCASLNRRADGFAVRVSCGGHPPAWIRRAGGDVATVGRPGIVLGCMPDAELTEQRAVLRGGDCLVMHTDGVTEARRPGDRDLFGTDRLRHLLATTPAGSADDLAAAIESAVLDFTGRQIIDDTAVVVVRVVDQPQS
jgi:serine phosphatase RsbU (regulator of sigma subunit)